MKKSKRSVSSILGCRSCKWFSPNNNCIKVSFSLEDINAGKEVHTLTAGSFRLSDIDKCPMKIDRGSVSLKDAQKTLDGLQNIGVIGGE